MTDREKVLQGLECCLADNCDRCPYEETLCDKGVMLMAIPEALARQILELLREQEPVKPRTEDAWPTPIHFCGSCGYSLPHMMDDEKPRYCCACGRAVKWDD